MANVENPYQIALGHNLVVTTNINDSIVTDYMLKVYFPKPGEDYPGESVFDTDEALTIPFNVNITNLDHKAAFISINDYTTEERAKYTGQQLDFQANDISDQIYLQVRRKDGTIINHNYVSSILPNGATSDIFNIWHNSDYVKSFIPEKIKEYFNIDGISDVRPSEILYLLTFSIITAEYKIVPDFKAYPSGTSVDSNLYFLFTSNGYDFYANEYHDSGIASALINRDIELKGIIGSVGYTVTIEYLVNTILPLLNRNIIGADSLDYYLTRYYDDGSFKLEYQTLNMDENTYYLDGGVEGSDLYVWPGTNSFEVSIGSNITISFPLPNEIYDGIDSSISYYIVIERVKR